MAEGAWRRQIADFIEDDLLLIRQLEPPDLPRIDQHHGPPGWTAVTFRPGDAITMIGPPMKDGSKGISLFYTIVPDGKRMYHDRPRNAGRLDGARCVIVDPI